MYRRIGVLLAIVLMLGGLMTSTAAAGNWSQTITQPKVHNEGKVEPTALGDWCPLPKIVVNVEYMGARTACSWGGLHSVVTFYDNGRIRLAAKMSPEGKTYLVKGVCEAVISCIYSPLTDLAVEKNYAANWSKNLIVTKELVETLRWGYDLSAGTRFLQFTAVGTKSVIVDTEGVPIFANAIALSKDGTWLAAELHDWGIARVDLRTLKVQRVMDQRYRYGYGRDPSLELAIAHDGSAIMIAGINAGFAFLSIPEGCGDSWNASLASGYGSNVIPCPYSELGISKAAPEAHLFYRPQFFENRAVVFARTTFGDSIVSVQSALTSESIEYLALGDSYSSGEGETDDNNYIAHTNTRSEKCHVSVRSYPFLLTMPQAKNVACSGAQIVDILGAERYSGQGNRLAGNEQQAMVMLEAEESFIPGRIPQIDFVELKNPKTVTVGIGGNDAGLMEKLRACVLPDMCEWAKPAQLQKTAYEIQAVYPRLVALFAALKEKIPTARLYSVGYPDVLSRTNSCGGLTGMLLNEAERVYISNTIKYLNQTIKAAARDSSVSFVSLDNIYGEHGLCGNDAKKAVNGLRIGDDIALTNFLPAVKLIGNESFHPTPFGHALAAEAIISKTNGLTDYKCHTECAVSTPPPAPNEYWKTSGMVHRAVKMDIANPKTFTTAKTIDLKLSRSSFVPASIVEISVHSDIKLLGTTTVGESGEIKATFKIPDDLPSGYHTIHIEGMTQEGDMVDIYQGIEKLSVAEASTAPVLKVDFSTKAASSTVESVDFVKPIAIQDKVGEDTRQTALVTVATLDTTRGKEITARSFYDESSKSSWIVIIVWVLALIGIMVVCLILAKLSRK